MIKIILAAVAFVAAACGSAASTAEPATAKGYLIAEIAVKDPATYEGYKAAVAPLIAEFGGRYLTRGGESEAVEGDEVNGRVIVLEFPSLAVARAFLNSDVYRPVAAIRLKSATSRLILVEGVAP
jgi:uncharacterized protein (DUF1330 family)